MYESIVIAASLILLIFSLHQQSIEALSGGLVAELGNNLDLRQIPTIELSPLSIPVNSTFYNNVSALDGYLIALIYNGTNGSAENKIHFLIRNTSQKAASSTTCGIGRGNPAEPGMSNVFFDCSKPVTVRGLGGELTFNVRSSGDPNRPYYTLKIQYNETPQNLTPPTSPRPTNLTVVTNVENSCQPKARCDNIKAEDFTVEIYEFRESSPNPLTLIKTFPGSAQGWKITSLPRFTQYDVNLSVPPHESNLGVDVSYSPGCQGSIHAGEALCTVNATLTTFLVGNGTHG